MEDTIDAWWTLADTLIVKYQDAGGGLAGTERQRPSYPKDWLEKNGFGTMKNPKAVPPPPAKEPIKAPVKK